MGKHFYDFYLFSMTDMQFKANQSDHANTSYLEAIFKDIFLSKRTISEKSLNVLQGRCGVEKVSERSSTEAFGVGATLGINFMF
jgi:hypothetical protein